MTDVEYAFINKVNHFYSNASKCVTNIGLYMYLFSCDVSSPCSMRIS